MKPAEGSTVIGKSITIRGDISGSEELYMDGDFEGSIKLPQSRLTIGPNARIKADLDAGDVVIYGTVNGNIHAGGRLELRNSAVLAGDILAQRLSIEENARVKGKVELAENTSHSRSQQPAAGVAATPGAPAHR